jgi:mRNA interferase RelE/StbE
MIVQSQLHLLGWLTYVESRRELDGRWSARRGSYRVLYTIDDAAAVVTVLTAGRRRDVYRR